MAKRTYTEDEFADAVALANVRAQLTTSDEKIRAFKARCLADKEHEHRARVLAWAAVGRATSKNDNDPISEWKCPAGWPPPYAEGGFEAYLAHNVPSWNGTSHSSAHVPTTAEEKALARFRAQVEGGK